MPRHDLTADKGHHLPDLPLDQIVRPFAHSLRGNHLNFTLLSRRIGMIADVRTQHFSLNDSPMSYLHVPHHFLQS
jgi:hypothetical protein